MVKIQKLPSGQLVITIPKRLAEYEGLEKGMEVDFKKHKAQSSKEVLISQRWFQLTTLLIQILMLLHPFLSPFRSVYRERDLVPQLLIIPIKSKPGCTSRSR